jgi:pyruvate-formate lyase-activating enzyme
MKKLLAIPLEDEELIELCRILMDRDPDGALEFLQTHVKGKARDLLEASSRFVKLGGKAQRGMTEAARALAKGRASDLPGR